MSIPDLIRYPAEGGRHRPDPRGPTRRIAALIAVFHFVRRLAPMNRQRRLTRVYRGPRAFLSPGASDIEIEAFVQKLTGKATDPIPAPVARRRDATRLRTIEPKADGTDAVRP
jgi:hypothetical protein